MFTVIRVNRNNTILWISESGTYNNKLCTFLGYSKKKGVMPE